MPDPAGHDSRSRKIALSRTLGRLRQRARLGGLLRALLLAVAADMGYDIAGIGLFRVTGKSIYYPPFFVVILVILTLRALAETTMPVFARRIDHRHHLKDRLASHLTFRRDPSVAPDLAEAQAAETLSHVDLPAISRGLRVRPWAHLAAIAVFTVALWFLLWRYPYVEPQNFAFRHGARMAGLVRELLPSGHPPVGDQTADSRGSDATSPDGEAGSEESGADGEAKKKAPPLEGMSPPPDQAADATAEPTPGPPPEDPGRNQEDTREPGDPSGADRKMRTAEQAPPGNQYGSSFNAESRMRILSRETTRRAAGLTTAPPRPLIPPPGISGTGGGRSFRLPSLPRLSLADRLPDRDILLDPDTIYVSPEGYAGKYHDLIMDYYRELLALKGEDHGSY
jgi:hypothetical protein